MKEIVYVGIDPGLNGAVAAITSKRRVVGVWDAPTSTVKRGKTNKRVYQPIIMANILRDLMQSTEIQIVGLEFVHAMPGQGVSSMFSMGMGVGMWEGVIAALQMPMEHVTPQRWKKLMLQAGTGDNKQASIIKAQQIFPKAAALYLTRKKDDGRAEAMLIAEYLRRTSQG